MQRDHDLFRGVGPVLDRRRALKVFAGVGAAGALSGALSACTSPSGTTRSTSTLRIGLVLPQSGPLQEVGFQMHNGFYLYLSLNGNQIAGMDTHVTVIDEGATADSGVRAVKAALKSDAYDVLVGVANSQVMTEIPDDVTSARTPLIGSNGSPADLRASPYLWRTSFVAGEASKALANYLLQIPAHLVQRDELSRPTSVTVYNDGTPDAVSESTNFVSTLAGAVPVHQIQASAGAPVAPAVFNQIRSFGSDLVYAATSVTNGQAFIDAYRKAGISAALCGPGALTERGSQSGGSTGVFTAMNYAPDLNNAANATFASAYYSYSQTNDKIPTAYAMTTYDAAAVLAVTISSLSGSIDSQSINNGLTRTQSIDSPRGRWQFNQGRTPLQQWYLRQVRADGPALDNRVLADLEALP
ncbi:MAG TPA: ABC transporter substrate-binding protein [Micromonosporaceae bacterium]